MVGFNSGSLGALMSDNGKFDFAATEEHVIYSEQSPDIELWNEPARGGDRHLFIFGGHFNVKEDMMPWFEELKPGLSDRYIWVLWYDWSKPFPLGADDLIAKLRKTSHQFNDIVYLAYSMGGLIARHMIARRWPVTRLATIAAPHTGLRWEIPWFVTEGVKSIKQGSPELLALNQDSYESSMRSRYLYCAITYSVENSLGMWTHDDDQVVDRPSAQGAGMAGGFLTAKTHLPFKGGVAPEIGQPHKLGVVPGYFRQVAKFLAQG
jgi:hypothetical protein